MERKVVGGCLVFAGERSLGDSNWSPVEDQPVLGLALMFGSPSLPLGMEIGGFYGHHSRYDVDVPGSGSMDFRSQVRELYMGIWRHVDMGGEIGEVLYPYVGIGGTQVHAESKAGPAGGSDVDEDDSYGGYAHAGVLVYLGRHVALALDARSVFGTGFELSGRHMNADYTQLALGLGLGF